MNTIRRRCAVSAILAPSVNATYVQSAMADREGDREGDRPLSLTCWTRSSATAEIARVGGHYAVQDHSRSLILPIFGTNRKPIRNFILVNNTDLTVDPLPHRLPDIVHTSIDQIIAFDRGTSLSRIGSQKPLRVSP